MQGSRHSIFKACHSSRSSRARRAQDQAGSTCKLQPKHDEYNHTHTCTHTVNKVAKGGLGKSEVAHTAFLSNILLHESFEPWMHIESFRNTHHRNNNIPTFINNVLQGEGLEPWLIFGASLRMAACKGETQERVSHDLLVPTTTANPNPTLVTIIPTTDGSSAQRVTHDPLDSTTTTANPNPTRVTTIPTTAGFRRDRSEKGGDTPQRNIHAHIHSDTHARHTQDRETHITRPHTPHTAHDNKYCIYTILHRKT